MTEQIYELDQYGFRKSEWVHGNKQRIETGHKTFDRQCTCIGRGNIMSGCCMGFYIRPFNEIECNGMTWKKGHLRDFDLQYWRESQTDSRVINRVLELTTNQSICLYRFAHYYQPKSGRGRHRRATGGDMERLTHGYVATRNDMLVQVWYNATYAKSYDVVQWCIPFIALDSADPRTNYCLYGLR